MKISEEDFKKLEEINNKKNIINNQMVRTSWLEIDLEVTKQQIKEAVIVLSEEEKKLMDDFTEKYGEITKLDLATGEYEVK